MITGATRSRAAILCFGGWGLQTMLHLQPRLRSIQAQRDARKVQAPDLTQITQFAALLPDLEEETPSLHLRRIRDDAALPPFYLEHLLARLDDRAQAVPSNNGRAPRESHGDGKWLPGRVPGLFRVEGLDLTATESERQARQLLAAADSMLAPLAWQTKASWYRNGASSGGALLGRGDLFRLGLREGVGLARALDTHLIAPIRQDNLAPGDPFVQTTLYVIAPFFEPLSSALVWPTVVHLLDYLGERHISQVVGIFALGSYAGDNSRAIEDAASYAALRELEALTGHNSTAADYVLDQMRSGEFAALADRWLGRPVFDRIYLVDREKSNQGLVRNPHELTVLVGNALEALIVSDGAQYVDEQLGIDLRNAHEQPYSLLGAATDYVPLDYIFQAVHQQEEKRLVRELLLDPGDVEKTRSTATLTQLGATQKQVLAHLVGQMPDLFADVAPQSIDDLQIDPDFLVPPTLAVALRGQAPETWRRQIEAQLEVAVEEFENLVGEETLDQAWGLDGLRTNGLPRQLGDDRLLPATAQQMRRHIVDLLAESPAGLRQAQAHLADWLEQVERERQQILESMVSRQRSQDRIQKQLALRHWRAHYDRAAAHRPDLGGTLLRSTLIWVTVVGIAIAYWITFERPVDPIADGLPLLGLVLGSYAGALWAYRRRWTRLQRLRRQRLALAQADLTAVLQERVQRGLLRVYDHLAQMLRQMAHALEDAHEALNLWSADEGMPPVPPIPALATHLYQPHINARLWERCLSFLQSQEDGEGRQGTERLRESWRSTRWRRQLEQLLLGQAPSEGPLALALHDLLRGSVQQAIADLSAAGDVREELVRLLATECNLEHLLWRDAAAPRHPLLHGNANGSGSGLQNLLHRHLETMRSRAKPAANYDVADRAASGGVAHGIPVEFAAVSGRPDSDLDEMTLREFRMATLPTDDPFRLTLVRTVHGLTLADLHNTQRYALELSLITRTGRAQVLLDTRRPHLLYGLEPAADEVRGQEIRDRGSGIGGSAAYSLRDR